MADTTRSFEIGHLYRRATLHKELGGQTQGGISTPAKVPFVMLITGASGKRYGYRDEWIDEGSFLYTGEGRHGDMVMKSGNRAIRDHKENSKSLFLFEQDTHDKRFLRFLGEMEYVTHSLRDAPDEEGKIRKAIVFQLRPIGSIVPDSALVSAALAGEMARPNTPRGGGFGSVETNRKVEQAAIKIVRSHYEQSGWNVVSVEAEKTGAKIPGKVLGVTKLKSAGHSTVLFTQTEGPTDGAIVTISNPAPRNQKPKPTNVLGGPDKGPAISTVENPKPIPQ